MRSILLVEDSLPVGTMIQKRLEKKGDFQVVWAKNMAEALNVLAGKESDFFAALLDFKLPDAPKGEIISHVVSQNIPIIVFTAYVSENVRQKVWDYKVVDYVLKEDVLSLDYIVSLLNRLEKNRHTKVLVVDKDKERQQLITQLLDVHHYQTLAVSSGQAVLSLLDEYPETRLVIAASEAQDMDGLALLQKIRRNFPKEALAIMGVVDAGEHIKAARFLKYGANHFIVRQTVLPEEFYCSVRLLIESVEQFQQLRTTALNDYLTGIHNRRYFFISGEKLFASARRQNLSLVCAMLDIDHFKKVNDKFGHETGDLVLQNVASILKNRMRKTDIVARIGGEEFCILAVNMDLYSVTRIFDELRAKVEHTPVMLDDGMGEIHVTISIGVATHLPDSLEDMIKLADSYLYEAKENGRNRVVSDLGNRQF